jgi:hypothetical protein
MFPRGTETVGGHTWAPPVEAPEKKTEEPLPAIAPVAPALPEPPKPEPKPQAHRTHPARVNPQPKHHGRL